MKILPALIIITLSVTMSKYSKLVSKYNSWLGGFLKQYGVNFGLSKTVGDTPSNKEN